jgi:hypothetical protein
MAANNFDFTESGYFPDSYNFNFVSSVFTFNVLAGLSNYFTAIWADPDANINNSKKMYVTSAAAFSVVTLDELSPVLVDYYTTTHFGAGNEVLEQEDIKDINIVM